MTTDLTKAYIKQYLKAMGMGASYDPITNWYTDEDTPRNEFNAVWIREGPETAERHSHGEDTKNQLFEIHTWHSDENARKRVRYLMELFPYLSLETLAYDDFAGTLAKWTNVNDTPTIVAGELQMNGIDEHYLPVATSTDEVSRVDFTISSADTSTATSYVLLKSTTTNVALAGLNGGNIVYGAGTTIQAATNATEYDVSIRNIDFNASTYDIFIDGSIAIENAPFLNAATSLNRVYIVASAGTTIYDDVYVYRWPGVDYTANLKQESIITTPLGKGAYDQYHHRMLYEYKRMGAISE